MCWQWIFLCCLSCPVLSLSWEGPVQRFSTIDHWEEKLQLRKRRLTRPVTDVACTDRLVSGDGMKVEVEICLTASTNTRSNRLST
ncbi:hypothetical protein V8C26DRAFT_412565 [Trichoderma gracile]